MRIWFAAQTCFVHAAKCRRSHQAHRVQFAWVDGSTSPNTIRIRRANAFQDFRCRIEVDFERIGNSWRSLASRSYYSSSLTHHSTGRLAVVCLIYIWHKPTSQGTFRTQSGHGNAGTCNWSTCYAANGCAAEWCSAVADSMTAKSRHPFWCQLEFDEVFLAVKSNEPSITTYLQPEWQFAYSHQSYDSYLAHNRATSLPFQHKLRAAYSARWLNGSRMHSYPK